MFEPGVLQVPRSAPREMPKEGSAVSTSGSQEAVRLYLADIPRCTPQLGTVSPRARLEPIATKH